VDEFHSQLGGHEAASDGIITDLDYSSEMYEIEQQSIVLHEILNDTVLDYIQVVMAKIYVATARGK